MIFWFIFLLLIMGVGLASGIYLYFGTEYDFRQVDAEMLNYRVGKCLLENEINFPPEKNLNDSFFEKCRLNQEAINESLFIFIKTNGKEYEAGPGDKTQCSLGNLNEKFPRCKNSTFFKNSKKFFILTGSNQELTKKIT